MKLYPKNILYVVNDAQDKALYNDSLIARNVSWISGRSPKMPFSCEAVIRYHHKSVGCTVASLIKARFAGAKARRGGRGIKNDGLLVKFSSPQRAITSGQSVVFYKGDEVLGGGVIDKA